MQSFSVTAGLIGLSIAFRLVFLLVSLDFSKHLQHIVLVLFLHFVLVIRIVEHIHHQLAVLHHILFVVGQVQVLVVLVLLDEYRVLTTFRVHVLADTIIFVITLLCFFYLLLDFFLL